jgi:2-polyprenyl-6-methoxyphenol hydroxylase-like FAD-dependent oxidoreductase
MERTDGHTDVVIAGAGPTGLVLALWLVRSGVRVRIVDPALEPGTTSRALILHARNLEFYRQLGFADRAVAQGVEFNAVNLWARGRHVARVPLGDIGAGVSAFPYMLILPQDRQERLLIEQLAGEHVRVERGTSVVSFEQDAESVQVHLRGPDGASEHVRALYLAGCDGAHSTVRRQLGIGFPGGTYEDMYYVADVHATGPAVDHELHIALDDVDFLAVFPLTGDHHVRLVGQVQHGAATAGSTPMESHEARQALGWSDIDAKLVQRMQLTVSDVDWFSSYHVHHRVAASFRTGRVFLLGDAAHIHSPVGGQGMNTGIGDAVNLAWKLADVIRGRATPALLDSYEPERIRFARTLVATTDRVFQFVTADGALAAFVRLRVVPWLAPLAFRLKAVRRFMFRTVSQTALHYPESPLSDGAAGGVRGGDRLPWVRLDPPQHGFSDNYAPLDARSWQVHCYGVARAELVAHCEAEGLPLYEFEWTAALGTAGLVRGAVFLVRPDGYVACAGVGSEIMAKIKGTEHLIGRSSAPSP